jgi:hypothetical protein
MIFRIALLTLVIGIAGCGGGTSSSSTPNNPSATLITLETATGTILPGVTITLSTGISNTNVPTGVISTQVTNSNGQATFSSLPLTGVLCVSANEPLGAGFTFVAQCFEPFPAAYTLI